MNIIHVWEQKIVQSRQDICIKKTTKKKELINQRYIPFSQSYTFDWSILINQTRETCREREKRKRLMQTKKSVFERCEYKIGCTANGQTVRKFQTFQEFQIVAHDLSTHTHTHWTISVFKWWDCKIVIACFRINYRPQILSCRKSTARA